MIVMLVIFLLLPCYKRYFLFFLFLFLIFLIQKPFEIRLILVQIQRCRAIIGNLHRLGVNNAVVTNLDGKIFANIFPQGDFFSKRASSFFW